MNDCTCSRAPSFARYCPDCGSAMFKLCRNTKCRLPLAVWMRFCTACGQRAADD